MGDLKKNYETMQTELNKKCQEDIKVIKHVIYLYLLNSYKLY